MWPAHPTAPCVFFPQCDRPSESRELVRVWTRTGRSPLRTRGCGVGTPKPSSICPDLDVRVGLIVRMILPKTTAPEIENEERPQLGPVRCASCIWSDVPGMFWCGSRWLVEKGRCTKSVLPGVSGMEARRGSLLDHGFGEASGRGEADAFHCFGRFAGIFEQRHVVGSEVRAVGFSCFQGVFFACLSKSHQVSVRGRLPSAFLATSLPQLSGERRFWGHCGVCWAGR